MQYSKLAPDSELGPPMAQVMMIVWVPAELARAGNLVDPEGVTWRVRKAFTVELEREDVPHGWKVGGLG
jgi:hypothetical protein